MSEPRRLLLLNYEFPPLGGGGGNATREIGRELAAMGETVHVLTTAWRGLARTEIDGGAHIHRIPALRMRPDRCSVAEMVAYMVSATARVTALARREKIDAALAFFSLPTAPVAWWLKRRTGIPYAVSLQGGDVPGFTPDQLKLWHSITGGAITALWKDAGAVVANSDGLAELARAHAPGVDVGVIPAGVPVDTGTAKVDYDGGREIRLLFVGRLVHQKGLDVLMDALAQLPASGPDWRLILAGDGPEWTAIAGKAARLGMKRQLDFLGWCGKAELADIYRKADIFVLPSRDEGMSNALLEAMASGLPVVCTDVAGMRDVITPDDNGLIVMPENAAQLAQALTRLMADGALRARLGRSARGHVQRRFSWTRAARSWRAILHRLADQRANKKASA
ncbi:MAG: glycosyltransferase family 4 protein [Rhodobacteraceae bacterium]|nr:glycosyltransferase family 4 protein [Paracoccaceae bacterium]